MSLKTVMNKAEETAAYLTVLANAKRIEIVCLLDGTEFDSSAGGDPFAFQVFHFLNW